MTDALAGLYSHSLPATRTGPLYNAFSYPTKISAEAVAVFIACHTQPGDSVLDVFGGSGTTGVAALLCERPTPAMRAMAANAGLSPVWGPRNATVYELSEIGSLLGRVMTHSPEPSAFARAASSLIDSASAMTPTLYQAAGPDGQDGVIRHVIWSDVVTCPQCGVPSTYADVRVRYAPLRFVETSRCEECGFEGTCDSWKRKTETVPDVLTGEPLTRRARVPWRVYGKTGTKNWARRATTADALPESSASLPGDAPLAELNLGDLYRSGYHLGMTHLHHLYTVRNFQALANLWTLVDSYPEELRDALRLFVLSYNATHSTLMTRVVLKKNSTDFVLTGAQSGVLYVSGLPVEKNVFNGLRRKVGVFARAFEALHGTTGRVDVVTGSSTQLDLPDASIDYVFTDPPFGAYIPYSEINQVNELWLGRRTDIRDEAIVSTAQGKGLDEYQRLLTEVFAEAARVMKPNAEGTVVFHSAHASVWQALAASLADAGLTVIAASVLDKTQGSFKQVNGHVAVSGDPLLRVRRSEAINRPTPVTATAGVLSDPADKREQERMYSRMVGQALVAGTPVTLSARDFYRQMTSGDSR